MTHEPYADIRRRPDGSIDTDFYACRAVHMRNEARRDAPARWLRRLSRLAGKAGSGRPAACRPLVSSAPGRDPLTSS